jgi:pyruvate/2-oxoglutarate/acetoin dehydrogenase E1 component
LQWELDFDCVKKMREWIEENKIASANELNDIENGAIEYVNTCRKNAWEAFIAPMKKELADVIDLLGVITHPSAVEAVKTLVSTKDAIRKDIGMAINKVLIATISSQIEGRSELKEYYEAFIKENHNRYSSYLHSASNSSIGSIGEIKAEYADEILVDGREVVLACFDAALERDPRVFAFGEDVGTIGDVNQGFAGMQEKYGELRVSDTGIRELSIIGQGIGTALRGLRPIAEIQYLDYLLYALQIMSDDIATLQYRTRGGQKAPIIIRTRGHRLEGIWHSGSPMGMIVHAVRGMHVCVPRNMTQAAGMYNLLLKADEPALVIECLNGYRLKEKMPSNIGEFTVPLGMPEIINNGNDVTIVGYGSTLRIIQDAIKKLEEVGISCELIDVQTLLPFDTSHTIVDSIKKTNKVVFIDEDVPGGATSYMMQKVLEEQKAYLHLDAAPLTITSKAHRPAYGTDGDYFSKPNAEEIFIRIYELMSEYNPNKYPVF